MLFFWLIKMRVASGCFGTNSAQPIWRMVGLFSIDMWLRVCVRLCVFSYAFFMFLRKCLCMCACSYVKGCFFLHKLTGLPMTFQPTSYPDSNVIDNQVRST